MTGRPDIVTMRILLLPLVFGLLAGCNREQKAPAVRPGSESLEKLAAVKPPKSSMFTQSAGALPSDVCAQILRVSEQGQLIVDRSDPARLVVSGALWPRVPPEVQRSIVECVKNSRPAAARGTAMQVVNSGG